MLLKERPFMKVRDGFVLREVAGQAVVIATGEASKSFHGMVKLNGTGKVIWQGLAEGLTEEQIAGRLTTEYEVTPEQAVADVQAFVQKMADEGFLA